MTDEREDKIPRFPAAAPTTPTPPLKPVPESAGESERLFRTMADAIPQLAWMAQPDGFIFWYNRRWYEYTGTPPHQMEGWGWQSVHDPATLPKVMETWKTSLATGQPFDMEFPLRGADGRFRWFLTRVLPLRDAAGRVVRWFGTNTDISAKREAEEALRQSAERLRLTLEAGAMGTFEVDLTTGEGQWNATEFELLGLAPGAAPANPETFFRFVHPDDVAAVRARWEEATRIGNLDAEFRIVRADGQIRWLAGKGRFLFATPPNADQPSEPRPERFVGVNFDITERRQAEEALRTSERLYRAIGESIDYGIWICDPEGRNTYASDSFLKLVGISQEQCANLGWGDVLHPDDAPATIEAWKQCVQTGGPWYREHRYRGADGQWHPILACGVPVLNERGEITAWAGINLDISRLKHAEEQLRDLSQRLAYHVEHSPLAVIEWGADMRLTRWSAEAERLFGWKAEEVLGKRMEDFRWIYTEDAPQVAAVSVDLRQGTNPRRFSANRNYRKDGSVVHCEWYNSSLLDADGTLVSILSLVLDVTDRKRTEEALKFLVECGANPSGEDFFRALARFLGQSLDMDFVCIDRLQDDLLAATTLAMYVDGKFDDNVSYTLKDTPCGDVVGKNVCAFPRQVRHLFPNDAVLQHLAAESYVGTTLWNSKGQPIGLIAVIGRKPLADTSLPAAILQLAAVRAAGELERRQAEDALRRLNRTLRALSNSDQARMRATDEAQYLREVCSIIVQDCGHVLAWVGFALQDQAHTVHPVAHAGVDDGYLQTAHITWADNERGRGPTGTAIRTGQVSVCNNMLTDPRFGPWRQEAIRRGFASSIALPISAEGATFGALTIYSDKPAPFSDEEVSLLTELVGDLAQGIISLRLRRAHAQSAEALRQSEERYRSLFSTLIEGFCIIEVLFDPDHRPVDYRFLEINPAFEAQTGLRNAQGKRMRELAPDHEAHWFEIYGKVALTGEPARFVNEARALNRWYEVSAYRVGGADSRKVAILFNDISKRKQAEELIRQTNLLLEQRVAQRTAQLAAVNADLRARMDAYHRLEAEVARLIDNERRHLGMELHDNLCQQLAAAAMLTASLVKRLRDQDSPLADTADRIAASLTRAGDDAHALARGLLPVQVQADGLMVALAGLAERTRDMHNVACAFHCAAPVPVPSNTIATHLFRIAQEAINNALKHGKAKHITLSLARLEAVTLSIRDDGVGIPPEAQRTPGGGLRIMAYRARIIGADLRVDPAPNGGTLVQCILKDGAAAQ